MITLTVGLASLGRQFSSPAAAQMSIPGGLLSDNYTILIYNDGVPYTDGLLDYLVSYSTSSTRTITFLGVGNPTIQCSSGAAVIYNQQPYTTYQNLILKQLNSSYTVLAYAANVTYKNVTIDQNVAAYGFYLAGDSNIFDGIRVKQNGGFFNGTNVIVKNSYFTDVSGASFPTQSATGIMYNNIFDGCKPSITSLAGTFKFLNNTIINSSFAAFDSNGFDFYIQNNIFYQPSYIPVYIFFTENPSKFHMDNNYYYGASADLYDNQNSDEDNKNLYKYNMNDSGDYNNTYRNINNISSMDNFWNKYKYYIILLILTIIIIKIIF